MYIYIYIYTYNINQFRDIQRILKRIKADKDLRTGRLLDKKTILQETINTF